MKEPNEILKQIKDIIESNGRKMYFKEKNGEILLSDIMNGIIEWWEKISTSDQRCNMSNILLNKPKYLIGNEKWVIYNYICDLDTSITHIRAGKYAFYKIKQMLIPTPIQNDEYKEEYFHGVLNGEDVCLYCNHYIDKKEIIMSSQMTMDLRKNNNEMNMHNITKIFPNDIVLYYA